MVSESAAPGQPRLGEIERDEGGDDAEAGATQGQRQAEGGDPQEQDVADGHPLALKSAVGAIRVAATKLARHRAKMIDADGGEAPVGRGQDPQGRAHGEGRVGGDAVPGDDPGRVLAADPADSPHGGARGAQAFAGAQGQAADGQRAETEPEGMAQQGRQGHQGAAGGAGEHAVADGLPRPDGVRQVPGPGPAGEGGDVLEADQEPREAGADPQLEMEVGRERGQRDADAEVGDEGEADGGKDAQVDAGAGPGLGHGLPLADGSKDKAAG